MTFAAILRPDRVTFGGAGGLGLQRDGRDPLEPTTGVSRKSEVSTVTNLAETSGKMKSVKSWLSPAACGLTGAEPAETQDLKARGTQLLQAPGLLSAPCTFHHSHCLSQALVEDFKVT